MVCGALQRTVLRLHQTLRRGVWVLGHVSTDLALDSTPFGMETWPGKWPDWVREQEQTDERHPDDCPASQAAPAGPGPDQLVSHDHLAFPMAWDEEPSTPASHVYRAQEWEGVYDADALCAGGRNAEASGGEVSLMEESGWGGHGACPAAWGNAHRHSRGAP